jgi:hypothetical protein
VSFGWQCTGSFASFFFFDQSFTHARISPAALILTQEFLDKKSSNVALLLFLVMGHPRAVAHPRVPDATALLVSLAVTKTQCHTIRSSTLYQDQREDSFLRLGRKKMDLSPRGCG